MKTLRKLIQLLIGTTILDVWLIHPNEPTPYRGGHARTMRQEFAAYGLPPAAMYATGAAKVAAALGLIVGGVVPALARPAAVVMAMLMGGAVAMHVKIADPPKKSVPAAVLLLLSIFVAVTADDEQ